MRHRYFVPFDHWHRTESKSLILVLQGKVMGEEEDHDNLYSTYCD